MFIASSLPKHLQPYYGRLNLALRMRMERGEGRREAMRAILGSIPAKKRPTTLESLL